MGNEVKNLVGITPFIVVPAYNFNKSRSQLNTGFGIKDRCTGIAQEVGRNNIIISVTQNSLQFTFGSHIPRSANFFKSSGFLEVDGQVNDRNVQSRNAERHTGQFAVQRRNNFADSLGCTG